MTSLSKIESNSRAYGIHTDHQYAIIVLLFIVTNKMHYIFTICEKLSKVKKYMSCKTLQNPEHLFMGMADNKQ